MAIMLTTMDTDAAGRLLYLLQVASSSFPTGAFNHSYGFETLIDSGELATAAEFEVACRDWLQYAVTPGDAAIASHAYCAASKGDTDTLLALDRLAAAIKLSREAREASAKTGQALFRTLRDVFGPPLAVEYGRAIETGQAEGHYAVVFGAATAEAGIPQGEAILAYLQSSLVNMANVAGRLIPLGQIEIQRIVQRARPLLLRAAEDACRTERAMIGSMMVRLDIASMRHERLHTRLCMS